MNHCFIGLNRCSRCGGNDPNCYVCGIPDTQICFSPSDPEVDYDDSDENEEPDTPATSQ